MRDKKALRLFSAFNRKARKKRLSVFVSLSLLVSLFQTLPVLATGNSSAKGGGSVSKAAKAVKDSKKKPGYAPDRLIVKFRKAGGKDDAMIRILEKKFGVHDRKKLFDEHGNKAIGKKLGLDRVELCKLDGKSDPKVAAMEFKADPNVEYAEPDYILSTQTTTPNDPYYSSSDSWNQGFNDMYGLHNMNLGTAWDTTRGSSNVVVGVIDTGLDYNHPDISSNVWSNTDEIAGNGIDDDGNGKIDDTRGWDFANGDNDPIDDMGHGTHVSGTIAATTNNSTGVSGVTWYSKIMPVKVLDNYGSGSMTTVGDGIQYAVDNGAKVISMSIGGPNSDYVNDEVNYAFANGAVVVAAAGNSNSASPSCPGACENAIGVAAVDHNDVKADFSNFGDWVDVAAPGVDTLSLRANGTDMYGDGLHTVGTNYMRASGTSMATPHVSGLAALLFAEHPTWTNTQVMAQIAGTTHNINSLNSGYEGKLGTGRVDAAQAVNGTASCVIRPQGVAVSGGNGNDAVEPGETAVNLLATLKNVGAAATGVTATLSSSSQYVSIRNNSASFGNMGSWASATNPAGSLVFTVSPDAPLYQTLNFTLTISANGGAYTTTKNFTLKTESYSSKKIGSGAMPTINKAGQAAWAGVKENGSSIYDYEIYYYNGSATQQITDNSDFDYLPMINNAGQIVWMHYDGNDYELYLYSNGTTTQLTNNNLEDMFPQMNESGEITWQAYDGNDYEIFRYSNGTITQLTNNSYDDAIPQINNAGQIVWYGDDGNDTEIYRYSGGTTTQITNNYYPDSSPQINDAGQIVWEGSDGNDMEIYRYSGGTTTKLTDNNTFDTSPQINSAGQIAWYGHDGNDYEIYRYSGGTTTQLSNNGFNDFEAKIDENGQVVWYGFDGLDYEIYLYNGTSTRQYTDSDLGDVYPRISDTGQIVWNKDGEIWLALPIPPTSYSTKSLGSGTNSGEQINDSGQAVWSASDGTDYEIYYHNGTSTVQLTSNSYDDTNPQINNAGQITWQRTDGNDKEIFLYSGGTTTQITNNSYDDTAPQINNSGQIVWQGSDGTDNEVFRYSGGTTTQITNNNYDDTVPQINDSGQIVWLGYDGNDTEVYSYSGGTTTQITNNTSPEYGPQINGSGQIVWTGIDGNDSEIYRYSGGTTTQITNNTYVDFMPQINDSGEIVWFGYDGGDAEIFRYSGGAITKLTDNATSDSNPQINNNGQITWWGSDGNDGEVYLWDNNVTTRLTNNGTDDSFPQINNAGQVAWSGASQALMASPDAYEQDNSNTAAKTIATDGTVQTHTINPIGDEDWVKFTAAYGTTYQIRTQNLSAGMDTYIELYNQNGTSLLASDDDSGGGVSSLIGWTAPASGTYYVKARHYSSTGGGQYDIKITH